MDQHNPLDEVTSREFIFSALMVGMVMCIIGLAVFVFVTYFDVGGIVTTPPAEKVPECHVYYHQHNQIHAWKGELQ